MKVVPMLFGTAMLSLAGLSLGAQSPAPPPKTYPPMAALPEGEGKALVERICVGCHDPALVTFTRENEEGWAAIVNDMEARGAKGTKEELDLITAYLAKHFSRTSGFAPLQKPGVGAAAGQEIYQTLCAVCHQADGRGRENVAPSLVGSQLVLGAAGIPVRILLHGKRGATNVMPPLGAVMSDDQIAATLTYIRREWGHTAPAVNAATVTEIRALTSGRARPWTAEELLQTAGGGRGGH